MSLSPARNAAFEILMRVETTDAYTSELLHSSRFERLSTADHALVTELAMGVLRWRSVLDHKIAERCNQPPAKLDREVLTSLRLGAYQVLFLDRIPPHAAINESVELVKRAHKKSAAGMVNAVLRRMAGLYSVKKDEPDFRVAHPNWLVERWAQTYGEEMANKICRYDQAKPHAAVRITAAADNRAGIATTNVGAGALTRPAAPRAASGDHSPRSRTKASGTTQALPHERSDLEGMRVEPGKLLSRAALVESGDITRTRAFREGRLMIQDEASQLVALLVREGKNILDCCAAPGGKTRILAQQNPNAKVIAMDLHPHRAKLIRKLVADLNVQVVAADARNMPFAAKFDRILVDAPCSGTGTLARNPDIKWRLKPEDLARLQGYQIEILTAAKKHVAPGGRIVYSTCSLEPEENQQVVERAIAGDPCLRVLECKDELRKLQQSGELTYGDLDSLLTGHFLRTLPGVHPCDGFFAAVLQRE